jgi:hypothetical protein
MALSPFLNNNPNDLAYALGQVSKELKLADGERVEVFVTVDGRVVLTTGLIHPDSLVNHSSEKRLPHRGREKIRSYLAFTKFVRAFPYRTVRRIVPTVTTSKGNMIVSIRGKAVRSSRAMNKARTWSVGKGKTSYSAKPKVPRSSNLRPSPESLTRPFLRTFQTGQPLNTIQDVVPTTVYYREWTGSRTPGWGKIKRKRYVDNNHTVRIIDVGINRYCWHQEQPATGNFDLRIQPYDWVYAAPSSPVPSVELADFNALKRLIANSNTGIQSNLAQNIAQVSQLSALIFTNATMIASSLRQLKRFNIPGAIAALGAGQVSPKWKGAKGSPSIGKTVAQNWLQLQYGWKPLLSDIEGFLKIMGNISSTNDFVQKVRGSAKATKQFVDKTYPPGNSIIGFGNTGVTTHTVQTSVKYVLRMRMDNPLAALFAQTGFTNPVALGWELLPFSFVADWFLPIGDYLEALGAWKGFTFLGGSKTSFTRIKMDSAISYNGVSQLNPTVNVRLNANFQWDEIRLVRSALSSWPSPILPSFNSAGISGGSPILGKEGEFLKSRAVNAIALLAQAFK